MVQTITKTAQIKCINKNPREDRRHSITHVGGYVSEQWKITQPDAIRLIENREWDFYTLVNGHRADVVVATHLGHKYLKTTSDGDEPNNLLSLPECP